MATPKTLVTVDDILKLFEENKQDMDTTLAREIVMRIYQCDYFSVLYICGHLHLIILIEYFQELEEFEVCASIIDTITEHNKITNDNIPTKR